MTTAGRVATARGVHLKHGTAVTMSMSRIFLVFAAAMVLAAAPVRRAAASNASVDAAIAAILAQPDPVVVDGVTVNAPSLRWLYEGRSGSALWRDRVDAVIAVLGDAGTEGLDPSAYYTNAIATRRADRSTEGQAALDVLVSDAVLRYARDVRYGRIRPRTTADAAFEPAPDPATVVWVVVQARDVTEALRALPPPHPEYRALRAALADHRALLVGGLSWPLVPDGPTIRPGMSDPAVPALRARLAATGEYKGDTQTKSHKFDPALVDAVKAFQETHGLAMDGTVGPLVRAALNVGPATRAEQIVANMERWRWLPDDLGTRRVMVNVALQCVRLVDGGATEFEGPVIVGKTESSTPTFSSTITQVIFNPSWTVPDKIARKELLPKVQRDGGYFARQGIRLIGSWQPSSAEDDPERKNWGGAHGAAGFRLRQAPGPQNPLGRVKFLIPNVFGVYLHDTSNRNLFNKQRRLLSHGCVRVGGALDFADEILAEQASWSP